MNSIVSTAAIASATAIPNLETPLQSAVQASDQRLAALADLAVATYAAYERGVEEWYELDAKAGEMLRGIEYVRGDENEQRVVKEVGLVEAEARRRAIEHDACQLIEQVIAAKATSLEGIRAKLTVLSQVYLHGTDQYDEDFDGYKPDLVCSLMRDLDIPPRVIGSPNAAVCPSERKEQDPIFPAIEAHRQADAACIAVDGDIPDDLSDRCWDAFSAVLQTRPSTPQGLAALTSWSQERIVHLRANASSLHSSELQTLITTINDSVRGMSGLQPWSPPAVDSST